MENAEDKAAIASIVVGCVSILVGFCVPLCSVVFIILGVVLGIYGLRATNRALGWIGICINVAALVLAVVMWFVSFGILTGKIPLGPLGEAVGVELPTPRPNPAPAAPELMDWPETETGPETETETGMETETETGTETETETGPETETE